LLVRLRPFVSIQFHADRAVLQSDEVFEVRPLEPKLEKALRLLLDWNGVSLQRLVAECGEALASKLTRRLGECDLLQNSDTFFSAEAESPLELYYQVAFAEERSVSALSGRSVAIVGIGAVGGELARHFASSGIGTLHLIDGDVVEAANFNRQYLFDRGQIGSLKVDAAAQNLSRIEPGVQLFTHKILVQHPSDLMELSTAPLSAIICAADEPLQTVVDACAAFAEQKGIYFGMATVGLNSGAWGPLVPPSEITRFRTWFDDRVVNRHKGCGLPPSFGPTNAMISAALSRDLIALLIGERPPSLMTRISFHFDSLIVSQQSILIPS
jgi:ThiF family